MGDNGIPYTEDVIEEVLLATNRPVLFAGIADTDLASCICWKCREPTSKSAPLKKCTRCERARYCNNNICQREHYKTHKYFCRSVGSQKVLSETDGYTQFEQKREHRQIYVLECGQCHNDMFCSNTNSGCPKAIKWQTIGVSSNHPSLLELIDTVHRYYKKKAVRQGRQLSALRQLRCLYSKNEAAFGCEDAWLLKTFHYVCDAAANGNRIQYIQDLDYPRGRPFGNLAMADLAHYYGQSDPDDIKGDLTYTANSILHTASQQLAVDYHPGRCPAVLMELVRFLEKVLYQSGIQQVAGEPSIPYPIEFTMQPDDVFLIYLAKKRARHLLLR